MPLNSDGQKSITEGGTETFSLTTTGLLPGEEVFYKLTGVTASEVVGGQLTGTMVLDSSGHSTLAVTLASPVGQGLQGNLTLTITAYTGGPTLATASEAMTETPAPAVQGTGGFNLVAGSVVSISGQAITLSSMFHQTVGSNNPTYIDVTMLDRNEYAGAEGQPLGHFYGSGLQAPDFSKAEIPYLNAANSDAYENGLVFTYQTATGRYYNLTYGYFDQLTFVASPSQYENAYITIFGTNSAATLNAITASPTYYFQDPETLASLAANSGTGILGTVDVITRTDFAPQILTQATPLGIEAAANSFVGKTWNSEGCWTLASNIAAQAGSSLPATTPGGTSIVLSGGSPSTPTSNGEWIVAYYGGAHAGSTISAAEAIVCPGDVITTAWSGGGGHITTVVSGFGAQAQVIDNAAGTSNAANDGYTNDMIILPAHSLASEFSFNGAVASSIAIYRLDTPTIQDTTATVALTAGDTAILSKYVTATDAYGAGSRSITEYQVFDTETGTDAAGTFLVNGVIQTAHTANAPITVTAAQFASLALQTAGGSGGTDTVQIRAYNGAFWGDAVQLQFSLTAGPITGVLTAGQAVTDYSGNLLTTAISVSDSAADVASNLDSLSAVVAAGKISSISLTDSGTPTLAIAAAQLQADATALNDISGSYTLTVAAGTSAVSIAGLAGHATSVGFTGNASQYTIGTSNSEVTVTSGGVTDTLSNIAAIQFANVTEIVAASPGPAGAVTTGNVTELYSAVLAREPDVGGLTFYQTFLQKNPTTPLQQFAEFFLNSTEYTSAHSYAQTTAGDEQFITDSYQNLLHRTPSTAEVSFYETNVLAPAVGNLTPGTAAYASAALQAHALMLVYFSASAEFLGDVQVTAANPASTQHWLVLI